MDWDFTNEILASLNSGTFRSAELDFSDFPQLDGDCILDLRSPTVYRFDRATVERRLNELLPGGDWISLLKGTSPIVELETPALEELGLALAPYTAFGVLNGGMATSYADAKKNKAFGPPLYEALRGPLESWSHVLGGQPKGITPAFFQPDGTPGPSYMELKLRHLLLVGAAAQKKGHTGPGLKLFQMTSESTDEPIRSTWQKIGLGPALADLLRFASTPLDQTPTKVQDLVGTFTSAQDGLPRRVFTVEKDGSRVPYALPAGHGQNFRVLAPIYRQLQEQGYRFVYLGNVDNLGYLPSLKGLAILALRGAPAAFDFSFKTPFDVKGGVLYTKTDGRLNCADIGVAISAGQVAEAEARGIPILFNCATGLFDLNYLNQNLERIVQNLPIRLSEQDKDIGKYAQAEQVTWEVISLLEKPLIFGIEKNQRFLAAKLLLDCFLTSGLLESQASKDSAELKPYREMSARLHAGLAELLQGPLAFTRRDGRWEPETLAEIQKRLDASWRFVAV